LGGLFHSIVVCTSFAATREKVEEIVAYTSFGAFIIILIIIITLL
jgi:hypothetical protein